MRAHLLQPGVATALLVALPVRRAEIAAPIAATPVPRDEVLGATGAVLAAWNREIDRLATQEALPVLSEPQPRLENAMVEGEEKRSALRAHGARPPRATDSSAPLACAASAGA